MRPQVWTAENIADAIFQFAKCAYTSRHSPNVQQASTSFWRQEGNREVGEVRLEQAAAGAARRLAIAMATNTWTEKTYAGIAIVGITIGRAAFVELCSETAATTMCYIMDRIASRHLKTGIDRTELVRELVDAVSRRAPQDIANLIRDAYR